MACAGPVPWPPGPPAFPTPRWPLLVVGPAWDWSPVLGRVGRRGHRLRVVLTGLQDDVLELLGLDEPADRIDRELKLLAFRDRLLADLPGGDLQVLLGDGRDHVRGTQVERRQLGRVKPGPQTVVALAQIGDAGDTRQRGPAHP